MKYKVTLVQEISAPKFPAIGMCRFLMFPERSEGLWYLLTGLPICLGMKKRMSDTEIGTGKYGHALRSFYFIVNHNPLHRNLQYSHVSIAELNMLIYG